MSKTIKALLISASLISSGLFLTGIFSNAESHIDWLNRNSDNSKSNTLYKIRVDSSIFDTYGTIKDRNSDSIYIQTRLLKDNTTTGVKLDSKKLNIYAEGYNGCMAVIVKNQFVLHFGPNLNGYYEWQQIKNETITHIAHIKCAE
jgi:hypothetical protein